MRITVQSVSFELPKYPEKSGLSAIASTNVRAAAALSCCKSAVRVESALDNEKQRFVLQRSSTSARCDTSELGVCQHTAVTSLSIHRQPYGVSTTLVPDVL